MRADRKRHQRVRALFDEALRREPAERGNYLEQACAADLELRNDVARLLAAHLSVESFLERPACLPSAASFREDDFAGTPRFKIRRRLGVGGMGVVYEVDDTTLGEVVALKTLRWATAADLYRLKREFRSLADVVHPNLVCLYDLFADGEHCFFTMELVRGGNVVDYVRNADDGRPSAERLRSALRQLVHSVSFLHRLGKLHRDIKPSNVLATPEGRVVLLDFGLVAEFGPRTTSDDAGIAGGTPAYMAPEGTRGVASTEASDWYAVGATLFEALTGIAPSGVFTVDARRLRIELEPSWAERGPLADTLRAICLGLLRRDPAVRFTGEEALRRLGGEDGAPAAVHLAADAASPFIGRTRELIALDEALHAVLRGNAAVACLSGPSGIGKSALAHHFLQRAKTRHQALVLAGRCYEHESVPYKAFDSVVDNLSRYLGSLPRAEADQLMPAGVATLSRLFPVLLQVDAVLGATHGSGTMPMEPHVRRQRGFAALRDLLTSLARQRPLVLAIDDLQWSDVDSTVLLQELLRPPDPPSILLLVCCRSDGDANLSLRRLFDGTDAPEAPSVLTLGPLEDDDARTLIEAAAPQGAMTDERAQVIAREARGNPFFLEQLTRYVSRRAATAGNASFADMLQGSLRDLPSCARALLETLSICGRPMAPEVVLEAAGNEGAGRRLLAQLRAAKFIRSSGSPERIEMYHDRIRETVAACVSAETRRAIHGHVARTLVSRQIDDPEALFEHYAGAGDEERAADQAVFAARKAMVALAFERATWLYRQALARTGRTPEPVEWHAELADALANDGRPREAANAYLAASVGAGGSHRIELQRRGAEQFLIGGDIDRGMEVTTAVLTALGVRLWRTPLATVASLVWHRARLQWRGLELADRGTEQTRAGELLRVDAYWSVITGLGMVDLVRASEFSARHVLLALDASEPHRAVRALAGEGMFIASSGRAHRRHATTMIDRARAIAGSAGDPYSTAVCSLAESMAAILHGRWQEAHDHSLVALRVFRERCVGVTWELNSTYILFLWSLMYLGRLGELSRQLPPLLSEALERGNLALATELRTRMNLFWLAADQPDEGDRQVRESLARWSQNGFHRQHYSGMLARIQTELYRGNAQDAWGLITTHWPLLRRTQLFRVQVIRIEAWFLRARSALALAALQKNNRRLLAVARKDVRRITWEGVAWANPLALLLGASVASLEGKLRLAEQRLSRATEEFDEAGMALYAAVSRRRLAALQDAGPRRDTEHYASEWMAAQNIKNPTNFTRAFAAGFVDSS